MNVNVKPRSELKPILVNGDLVVVLRVRCEPVRGTRNVSVRVDPDTGNPLDFRLHGEHTWREGARLGEAPRSRVRKAWLAWSRENGAAQ